MFTFLFRLLISAVVLGSTACWVTAQTLTFERRVPITHGNIWCIPVYDGRDIVVSAESAEGIRLAKYDLAMNPTGTPVLVASTNDTPNHDRIADHKHIFQNDHHYLTYSVAGSGSGGYLYLLKLNKDFGWVASTLVASNDPPTNDMLMVGDGTNVYVGKFLPGTGHRIYSFAADLTFLGSKPIGGGPNRHGNGATAIYADNVFYVVAPDTLAPGQNNIYSRITFDHDWNCISNKTTILYDPGVLSIVSGLSRDPVSRSFIVTYSRSASHLGGPIYAAIYNPRWSLITNQDIVAGTFNRPHSVIVSNTFYLGYDGSNIELSVFSISNTATTLADPAMVDNAGNWFIWFTSTGYQLSGGPWNFGVLGKPVAADFDGDGYADPTMVDNAGNWFIWFTSTGYQLSGGPWNFGIASGNPVAADFDGDGYADPTMVDNAGNWYIWFTSSGYQLSGGPWNFGIASGMPVAADFDGDGYADPTMVDNAGNWYIWFSSSGYQLSGGPWNFGVSGTPLAADFDGL